jgi:transcriptional regulator with XRE-family HTH domain
MEKSIYTREYAVFLEHLRKARETKNLTQLEVAERLGQTQSFVSKAERGERRLDIVELRAFCSAMNVGFEEFVFQLEKAIRE